MEAQSLLTFSALGANEEVGGPVPGGGSPVGSGRTATAGFLQPHSPHLSHRIDLLSLYVRCLRTGRRPRVSLQTGAWEGTREGWQ